MNKQKTLERLNEDLKIIQAAQHMPLPDRVKLETNLVRTILLLEQAIAAENLEKRRLNSMAREMGITNPGP